MRRLILVASLLVLSGCGNVIGPFGPHKPERVDDPLYTINEQERRGRAFLPLPQESPKIAPPTTGFNVWPGTYGR